MKKFFVAACSFLLALTGCKAKDEAINGKWETAALIKDNVSLKTEYSFIEFEVKGNSVEVHGESGVNVFNGTVKASGNKFKADDFAVTKMMGPIEVQEFEDKFLEVLMSADSYEINGNKLTIKSSSKNMELQFNKVE